jgi:hypothetical protein
MLRARRSLQNSLSQAVIHSRTSGHRTGRRSSMSFATFRTSRRGGIALLQERTLVELGHEMTVDIDSGSSHL